MLSRVCKKLDKWLIHENSFRRAEGTLPIEECEILVVGQTALLEAKLGIEIAATMDVDLFKQLRGQVREEFERLLRAVGKSLDPVGHEAWMPSETEFNLIYDGKEVKCFVAKPEYVLISKALKNLPKNKNLLIEYLGNRPSELFLDLARKYRLDLEGILR